MKISLYLDVLFLALVIKTVTADVSDSREPYSAQQYCGSKLADIMKVICKGQYNFRKRNLIDLENWNTNELEDINTFDYPYYQSKQEVMPYMTPSLLRSKKRITDECCDKPCGISELRTYCAPNLH